MTSLASTTATRKRQAKLSIEGKLWVAEWSPAYGATRYRFFDKPHTDYFSTGDEIFTAEGYKQAEIFSHGFACGLAAEIGGAL